MNMDRMMMSKLLAVPSALLLAGAVSACNGDRANTQARGHEGAPINLTGCLQKGGGVMSSYILTQVNEPTRSVGTSGTAQPGVVAQEQMREARHAYVLDGDNDQLDNLVGKQVRVQGSIAESSDLNKPANDSRAADKRDETKRPDIDAGDLAKVNVQTISKVSDSCGNADQTSQK
jgi:hypothetical protein